MLKLPPRGPNHISKMYNWCRTSQTQLKNRGYWRELAAWLKVDGISHQGGSPIILTSQPTSLSICFHPISMHWWAFNNLTWWVWLPNLEGWTCLANIRNFTMTGKHTLPKYSMVGIILIVVNLNRDPLMKYTPLISFHSFFSLTKLWIWKAYLMIQ